MTRTFDFYLDAWLWTQRNMQGQPHTIVRLSWSQWAVDYNTVDHIAGTA